MPPTPSRAFIVRRRTQPPALRLFCFPYAGGGAGIYRPWQDLLPPQVEVVAVQPPGREQRLAEPAYSRVEPLLDHLMAGIEPLLDVPCIFFGYSLGATVAFELAQRLTARGQAPRALVVAARQAPHLPSRRKPIHHLPQDQFLAGLRELEGTPVEILEHPEMMALLTPMLRADFAMAETTPVGPRPALPCRLLAWAGQRDPDLLPEDVEAWQRYGDPSEFETFEGGHFFLHEQRAGVLERLSALARKLLA
jgi:medium-chain acyl-[acyl-carrier-protein] hydrolase